MRIKEKKQGNQKYDFFKILNQRNYYKLVFSLIFKAKYYQYQSVKLNEHSVHIRMYYISLKE